MVKTDIIGQKFGKLTVIGIDKSYLNPKNPKYICICECGNKKSIFKSSLTCGRSKSCGCNQYKGKKGINATHGMSKTRIYHEWLSMRNRCMPNTKNSKNYYCRGITVCDEWQNDFMHFYIWAMNNGYKDSLSLDRIDNDKGYYPDNCRWITIEEQQANKTNTIRITYQGKEYSLHSLCVYLNLPYKSIHKRYKKMKSKNEPIDIDKLLAPVRYSRCQ